MPLNNTYYFLEFNFGGQNGILQRDLKFGGNYKNDSKGEISFSILNTNKIIKNGENLQLVFYTNSLMNYSETYILYIKLKEQVLYYEDMSLNKSQTVYKNLSSEFFPLINGGILTVSLQKISP